jgi:hypothetical protein
VKKNKTLDYIKANRKGSREAEFEHTNGAFQSVTKAHKSLKPYSRKAKDSWKQEF